MADRFVGTMWAAVRGPVIFALILVTVLTACSTGGSDATSSDATSREPAAVVTTPSATRLSSTTPSGGAMSTTGAMPTTGAVPPAAASSSGESLRQLVRDDAFLRPAVKPVLACPGPATAGCIDQAESALGTIGLFGLPVYSVDDDPEARTLQALAASFIGPGGWAQRVDVACEVPTSPECSAWWTGFTASLEQLMAAFEVVDGPRQSLR